MTNEITWDNDVEATDPALLEALERDILRSKEILTFLAADEELVF